MNRVLDALFALGDVLSRVLLWLACIVLVAMVALACSNMVLRAVWVPVKGSYELMGFFGALAASFGMAATQRKKGHVAFTILAGVFPRAVDKAIDLFTAAVCSAFFLVAAWQGCGWAWSLVETGELSETLRMVYHPFAFASSFGVAVLGLVLACDFLKLATGREEKAG